MLKQVQKISNIKTIEVLLFCFLMTQNAQMILANEPKMNSDSALKKLEDIVTVGSRLNTQLSVEKIPYQVIALPKELIQKSGSNGMAELLQEQSGIYISGDPSTAQGSEIQMMGLTSAYVQVLEDGQNIGGRESGAFNLQRVPTFFVKRVEVIKGALSTLFGDNALAGIINVVTTPENKNIPLQAEMIGNSLGRYNLNLGTNIRLSEKNVFNFSLGGEWFTGYDHTPQEVGHTIKPYYFLSSRLHWVYKPHSKHQFRFIGRGFYNTISGPYLENNITLEHTTIIKDFMGNIEWKIQVLPEKLDLKMNVIYSHYNSNFSLTANPLSSATTNPNRTSYQDLSVVRGALLMRWFNLNGGGLFSAGIDLDEQTLSSDRYDRTRNLLNAATYIQQEWTNKHWTITAGGRLEIPEGLSLFFSPKIGAQFRVKKWSISASLGTGYRYPDFRQRFMNFNHSGSGYIVLGSESVGQNIGNLLTAKDLASYLQTYIPTPLRPETSIFAQVGLRFQISPNQHIQIWGFRNQIYDLILYYALPIRTSDNLSIFSYKNVNEVYTQGFDLQYELRLKLFSINTSYSFLMTREPAVENEFRNGKVFGRNEKGETYIVPESNYMGLFQRPQHLLSVNIRGIIPKWVDYFINFRYQDGLGWSDKNGNGYFDDASELAPAIFNIDLALSREFSISNTKFFVQAGIKNLIDQHAELYWPTTNGRNYFVKFSFSIL